MLLVAVAGDGISDESTLTALCHTHGLTPDQVLPLLLPQGDVDADTRAHDTDLRHPMLSHSEAFADGVYRWVEDLP